MAIRGKIFLYHAYRKEIFRRIGVLRAKSGKSAKKISTFRFWYILNRGLFFQPTQFPAKIKKIQIIYIGSLGSVRPRK